ncbi:gliding motility protein GldL [uncultured Parabacteroides sp.]|uniref:type IX secretion system motor protein PorL/GldL n=1 Tax=uncultured Parabacteroides sp. TaxID=512312 RepID=UPI00259154FE|nr:gliding motility protein GldL [uncultured Parabacteroides sp.]
MGKYRRYKNRIEMFLSSDMGKRVLNFCYSWGASIVIIGAMFKLLHLPYGNQILFIAMTVEALVFFISAFEHPSNEYHWEEVFPVLKSKNPMDRPDFAGTGMSNLINSSDNMDDDNTSGGININVGNGRKAGVAGNLGGTSVLSNLDVSEEVSDTLLNSYKSITDNSDGINQNSRGYVQQMEMLNRNISGLNTIYEIQLKSISSQIESIEHINGGLNRIREMYDGSVTDSSVFRNETEKMTRQLAELNQVYSRLLQAMTVNMGPATAYQQPAPQPQQPNYQQQQPNYQQPYQQQPYGYQQQAPYTNNPGQQSGR